MIDRLAAAAVLGGLRQRAWSLLTICAFLVLSAAAAAAPMFAEASDNASFQVLRDQIPATARQNDAAVVRISANVGTGSAAQEPVKADLRSVPGLTEPDLTGASLGFELARPDFWGSTVTVGGRTERGRLFAVGAPASELVAVGTLAPGDGLWLPEPMATALRAQPGDQIVLAVRRGARGEPRSATSTVAGVYAVDAAGRLPADVPGSTAWSLRRGDTPGDSEYRTLPAYLLVGDIATVERLAAAVDDHLFWSVESALAPGVTLAEARRTADDVEELRRRYATRLAEETDDPLALRFATGIGRVVATAETTTEAVRQRTRPVEWAATAVGLGSVLAVALLSARRRDREVRHAVAVGMSAPRVAALWSLEHLLPATLGAALGWLVAWQLVARLGPPGALGGSLAPAAGLSAGAALAGLLTVAGIAAATAARRVRPAPPATTRRALPWGAMLVIVALVAAAGLLGAGDAATGVDLLVPLLVLGAVGALAARLPGWFAGGGKRLPTSPARGVVWLARRRLGSGGAERRLAVVVVTAGLGMLLFALSAVQSTATSADDRVAVASGAEGVATLQDGSWELDAGAVSAPPEDPTQPDTKDPVPGVRTPPLPPGSTVVWYTDTRTPLDDDQKDLLIIDPARFREVALWGHGADLAAARAAVATLAAAPANENGAPRVITVADPASAQVDAIRAEVGFDTVDLPIAGRVAAFPGMRGRPMYVVSADALFAQLGRDDPRLRPRRQLDRNPLLPKTFLWSSGGAAGLQAVIDRTGLQPERIRTADDLRQEAAYVATDRARGYQLAVAGYLALLAVLTLCVYAQRTAALRRPTDLMLARVGLGRARIRRARALEFVLLALVAFGGAVAGVLALGPLGGRLLDDQPGLLPRFAFQLSGAGLAVTAAAAVVAVALAVLLTSARSAGAEEDAYRDD